MAAACEASAAYLKLAQYSGSESTDIERQTYLTQAVESSHSALKLYERFGFVQIVECTSEEILYRHSQALAANDQTAQAAEFLKRAYNEMIRKHDLIPAESPYQKTFLGNIQLHSEIQSAYAAQQTGAAPPLVTPHSDQRHPS